MIKPIDFYTSQKQSFLNKQKVIKGQLLWSSIIRFSLFSGVVLLIYLLFDNTQIVRSISVIGLVLFLFLVKRHGKLKEKKAKLTELIKINLTEIAVINKNAYDLENGKEYSNPNHAYSHDIDLFGRGSFFQYINRTVTQSGKDFLAKTLTSNTINDIELKQEAINELSKKPEWRQNYAATASLINTKTKIESIVNWLENYQGFVPKMMRYLPSIFLLFTLLLIGLVIAKQIAAIFIVYWLLLGLGISGIYVKKVNKLSALANQAKDTFRQYSQLLQEIESTSFKSLRLKENQDLLSRNNHLVSQVIQDFSKELDALDQRNNMLFGFLANGFALWDIKHSYRIEKWIEQNKNEVSKWFDVVAYFDSQNSLANYYFNHPNQLFPTITDKKTIIKSKALGHPLIDSKKRIDNDFEITKESFYIITGANMAGKSTFLRTVSLSIVMANVGLPVCAKEFCYTPIKLITSMRTSDSLSDDESYFFSELKRLKYIKDAIETEKHFIVLDEILKGTNSVDKAKGSRKFVEKLVASHSTGIIATHDLSLCKISKELKQVKNYFFDAEIINDELHFDYSFKDGICQNMNASFLLKKMEIV